MASYEAARKRIEAGQPIFRDKPGPESSAADIVRRVLRHKVDAATMTRLAKADRLLAMVVATKEACTVDVQKQMAASGDAAILELLGEESEG